ncbi:ribulose bisphosphate carboxylase/oxygenaseactivase, partial [Haematococcus lacustris]
VEKLVDAFPGQSIDFFGALRARVYDEKVRDFVTQLGVENLGKRLINSREGKVTFERPRMTLDENVKRVQLADAYMSGAELAGVGGSSLPEDYDGIAVGLKPAKRKLMA